MGKHHVFQGNPALFRLLICCIMLRSLIAPGFMLATGGQGPLGLDITLCNGPNGINTLKNITHKHHHSGNTHTPTRHDQGGKHFTASCGLWMASATFVGLPALDTDHLLASVDHSNPLNYLPPRSKEYLKLQHRPRAPPQYLS